MRTVQFLVALLLACVTTAQMGGMMGQGGPGGGMGGMGGQGGRPDGRAGDDSRAPPDIRALDLAIDEARLAEDDDVVKALTNIKRKHTRKMGDLMSDADAKQAMQEVDELSSKLVGTTGSERTELHQKLHAAIQQIEDEKFISMGFNEEDKEVHKALLREKHSIVIQLVDDDELRELSEQERSDLLNRFETVEIKMVAHMKDYFMAKAKAEL